MSRLIAFLCVATGHSKAKPDRSSQILTIHAGKWAVCPAGREDGHTWEETRGLNYDELIMSHALTRNTG